MISEQDKQAILNGAYGITRNGRKAKYIGTFYSEKYPNYFIFLDEDDKIFYGAKFTNDFREYENAVSNLDILGLWQDKPEPFDLERALAGEPVITRDNCKAYVQAMIEQSEELMYYTLIGYGFNGIHKEFLHWDKNGLSLKDDISCNDIVGMWKDPEPKTVTLTLPCPVLNSEIGKTYYTPIITDVDGYDPDGHFSDITEWVVDNEDGHIDWQSQHRLEEGLVFETKDDVKTWLDAMKDNRR